MLLALREILFDLSGYETKMCESYEWCDKDEILDDYHFILEDKCDIYLNINSGNYVKIFKITNN